MLRKQLSSSAILALFVIFAAGSTESDSSDSSASSFATSGTTSSTYGKPDQQPVPYMTRIEREHVSMRTFDGSKFHDTKEGIQLELVLFSVWATMLSEASQHDLSTAERAKVARFKEEVSAAQIRELPRLREAWARVLNSGMAEHNMTITSAGAGNRTLRLTSPLFMSSRLIAPFHAKVFEQAGILRFRRIEYRAYVGADKYHYTIDSPSDGAIRKITESGLVPIP